MSGVCLNVQSALLNRAANAKLTEKSYLLWYPNCSNTSNDWDRQVPGRWIKVMLVQCKEILNFVGLRARGLPFPWPCFEKLDGFLAGVKLKCVNVSGLLATKACKRYR